MPRLPRVVVPGLPHHVTQRGNRRQQILFCQEDYHGYLELMAEWWSSARAHLRVRDDRLVKVMPLLERVGDWGEFLSGGVEAETMDEFRRHERTGRPLGSEGFLAGLERMLGRILRPQEPGPKPRADPR